MQCATERVLDPCPFVLYTLAFFLYLTPNPHEMFRGHGPQYLAFWGAVNLLSLVLQTRGWTQDTNNIRSTHDSD